MICISLSTVVYCVGLRPAITSWTSRTVLGPRLQSTVRISNSASVGLGGPSAIYEDITTMIFVCQAERLSRQPLAQVQVRLVALEGVHPGRRVRRHRETADRGDSAAVGGHE